MVPQCHGLLLGVGLGLSLWTGHVAGQGFWHNCTRWTLGWEAGTVYRRFMVAECGDGGKRTKASFLPLNDCITNSEGKMVAMKNGGVADSCSLCETAGSTLKCQCGRSYGGPVLSTIDLNTVIKNVDGILGCYDYLGIEIDSMNASPA